MNRLKLSTQILIIIVCCVVAIPVIVFSFITPILRLAVSKNIYSTLDYQLDLTFSDSNKLLNSLMIITANGSIEHINLKETENILTIDEISDLIESVQAKSVGDSKGNIRLRSGGYIYYVCRVYEDRSAKISFAVSGGVFSSESLMKYVALSMLFMILPVIFLLVWFSYFSRSIHSIERAVTDDSVKKKCLSKELQSLSDTIDVYKEEIKEATEQKQRLLQNISHELKTPITTIKMYAEGIEDGIYKDGDIKKSTSIIKEETDVLLDRVTKIMNINKLYHIETSEVPQKYEKIVLAEVMFEMLEKYDKRAPDVHFTAELERSEWRGSSEIWKNIIENIFDNNIKHGAKNINITMKKGLLVIENDGDKIEDEIFARIFEPFMKGQNGNFGLGLNIIQRALKLLDYKVEIKNADGEKGVIYKISEK